MRIKSEESEQSSQLLLNEYLLNHSVSRDALSELLHFAVWMDEGLTTSEELFQNCTCTDTSSPQRDVKISFEETLQSSAETQVDWLGLALNLEAQAKRVESKTVEKTMTAAAHGLRLMGYVQKEQEIKPWNEKRVYIIPIDAQTNGTETDIEGFLRRYKFTFWVDGPVASNEEN